MAVLLCPLCSQPRFNNLESLRLSLINAATQSISCPICNEILMGLDKLTIHLFGHTLDQNPERSQCMELKIPGLEETEAKAEAGFKASADEKINFAGEESLTTATNEYAEISLARRVGEQKTENISGSTVNMEDLSFLTSWENPVRMEKSKDSESKSVTPEATREDNSEDGTQEDSAQLSEYMSDLLNKKLPVLNFVFTMDAPEKSEPVQESETEQFKCPACDFVFQNSIVLSMHQELVHSSGRTQESGGGGSRASPKSPPSADVLKELLLPRYDCHLCSKSFKMKGSLVVHYRVAHLGEPSSESGTQGSGAPDEKSFRCSICSKSFKKEQHLTQHIKTHEGKQWRCETCNKHFTTKYFLKKHQRLHTGEMPYACQVCNKTFTFQQSYHKHLLYHSDEKPHRCSECGRSFKELSTLHNHERIHSGEKPFACETCGKCFRQRVSYIVHQRIHTGVLPYQCTACNKKFRYKVSQRSHKCAAQPPGVVVRQPGDLIRRILERGFPIPTMTN